jgi:hypothetical protein
MYLTNPSIELDEILYGRLTNLNLFLFLVMLQRMPMGVLCATLWSMPFPILLNYTSKPFRNTKYYEEYYILGYNAV